MDMDSNNYELHIYGEGSQRTRIQKYIEKMNLSNKVFLKGILKDAILLNKNAKMFVLSSNYEGYPNVLIEAMSCGIPCISTNFDSGIAYNLLVSNDAGRVVEVNNYVALANEMKYIILNENDVKRMIANGLKIKNDLTVQKIGDKWDSFIKMILANYKGNNV
jgi:glycosyltransferase involved in cell wall biosynthesis